MGENPAITVGTEPVPLTIETVNIAIRGHQLISKRLFDVIMHIIIDNNLAEYDCLNEIIFSEDQPEGKFGSFNVSRKDITINLQRHFDDAVEMVKSEDLSVFSIRGHLWFGLLGTCIHEILHAIAFAIDPETMLNTDRKTIEKGIKQETIEYRDKLIRDYGVEPPQMADEPFFGTRAMEFYVKHVKDNAEQWAINQNAVHKTGFIFMIDDEAKFETFREWFRSSFDHFKDIEWDKDPEPLKSVDVVDEKPDEDVEEPASIPEPAAAVETEVIPSPSAEVITALPEGLDPESMALLDMEETAEVNMEEAFIPAEVDNAPTVIPAPVTAAAAPTQQPLPLKEVAVATVCSECNMALIEGAKFCAHCGTSVIKTPKPVLVEEVVVATNVPQAAPQPVQQFSSGAKRPMRHDLPNYNLAAEQIRACVGEVFVRCYQHIFNKCGFLPGQNPSFAPELRNAITEPISVVGLPFIDEILIGMDSTDPLNGNFTWCTPPIEGMIRGKITKNLGVPSYTLYFNFNGHEAKRVIMPQNQWKVATTGGYSGPAQRAQQGATIIWMMDGDDSTPGQKWRAKIENGSLEWLI